MLIISMYYVIRNNFIMNIFIEIIEGIPQGNGLASSLRFRRANFTPIVLQ